jgi:hypothetical protein
MLSAGKLFNRFPFVFDPKVKNPATAMIKHIARDMPVE